MMGSFRNEFSNKFHEKYTEHGENLIYVCV